MEAEIIQEKAFDQDFIDVKLAEAQKLYPNKVIYTLKIPKNNNPKDVFEDWAYGFITRPDRNIMLMIFSKLEENKTIALDMILKNSLIQSVSDPAILLEDDLYYSALTSVATVIEIRKAELKKN